MNKFTSSKMFMSLLALAFAVILFVNANSTSGIFSKNKVLVSQPTLSAVANDVSIKVKYDDKKYFMSGYQETTTVYLKSSNKILLDTEANLETRKFSLEADLSKYKEGTYEVPVKIKNLSNGVEATLKDNKITVTIEKRETKKFNVQTKIHDNLLKNGYILDKISLDPSQVEITTGSKTMKAISDVLVSIDEQDGIMSDFSKKLEVYALDNKGNILSVISSPSTVLVNLKVTAPSKSVPIKFLQSGKIPSKIDRYDFISDTKNVEIVGSRELLDKIDEAHVLIDTSNITETGTNNYKVEPINGVKIYPSTVSVTVTPHAKEETKKSED